MDQPVQAQNPVLDRLIFTAKNMSIWVKLLGIINIISGALTALTLVGIIIAWLPIWLGILLFQAGNRADEALASKRPDQLITMMEKLRLFFLIQGVMIIVMFGVGILAFLIFGASMITMFDQMNY